MDKVLATLLPVLLVMGTGFLLRYRGFFDDRFQQTLSALVYWVILPAMIFYSLSIAEADWRMVFQIGKVFFLATALTAVLFMLLARAMRLPRVEMVTSIHAVYRGNLALIGFPLLLLVFSPSERDAGAAAAVLVLAPSMLLYNVSAVLLFSWYGTADAAPPAKRFWSAALQLRSNPLIIATVLGSAVLFTGWKIPGPFTEFFRLVGQPAGMLALICIGASLAGMAHTGQLKLVGLASLFKVAMLPLLALGLAVGFDLDRDALRILMIFACCPTAAASAIVAAQLGGDEKLASGIIAASTVASMLPLALVIAWLF